MSQLKRAEVGAIKPSGSGLLSSGSGGGAVASSGMSGPRNGGRGMMQSMGSGSTNRSRSRSPIQQPVFGRMGPGLLGPGAPPPPGGALMFAPGQAAAASQAQQLTALPMPGGIRLIRPAGMSVAGGIPGSMAGGFQIITGGPGGAPQLVASGPGGTAFFLPSGGASGFGAPPGSGNALIPIQQPPGGIFMQQPGGGFIFSQPPQQNQQQPIVIRPQQMQSKYLHEYCLLRDSLYKSQLYIVLIHTYSMSYLKLKTIESRGTNHN